MMLPVVIKSILKTRYKSEHIAGALRRYHTLVINHLFDNSLHVWHDLKYCKLRLALLKELKSFSAKYKSNVLIVAAAGLVD